MISASFLHHTSLSKATPRDAFFLYQSSRPFSIIPQTRLIERTFTDVYAEIPGQPEGKVMKLLSIDPSNYEDAPVEGIRRILEDFTGNKIPRTSKVPTDSIEWIRMGTTVATNALLERKRERISLCVTKGFGIFYKLGTRLAQISLLLLFQNLQICMRKL
ncbi:hypothetical protein L1887_17909 [Cichorium endivia]|nr:hypothetical protein L1887_17909 [Cichorium endivia]